MAKHDDEEETEHESYGMIALNRVTGNPGRMFGSHIRDHHTFVRLVVKRGVRVHSLSRDWYRGTGRPLIELDLSAAQFADLLTTMNVGDGVPCTVRFADGTMKAHPPDEELESEKVRTNFRKKAEEVSEKLREARSRIDAILSKKSVTQADRRAVSALLDRFVQEVGSNMPFVLESFEESADKVVSHAKAEIDAFATQVVMTAGTEALTQNRLASGNAPPILPPGKDEPSE